MMATTPLDPQTRERLITGEEFFRMGEEATMGLELIDGKIVGQNMPTGYRHGDIELTLGSILRAYVLSKKLGKVLSGEVGIYIRRNPDAVRAPDLLYISQARFGRVQSQSYLDVAPELVVEIMSPSDTWSEVKLKLRDYFAAGVLVAWIVDPASQTVTAYRADSSVQEFTAQDTLTAEDVLPGLSIRVSEIFE